MAHEIEKKYVLPLERRQPLLDKLAEIGAEFEGEDFEENLIFRGGMLSLKEAVLRLRRTENKTILTYKEALPATGEESQTKIKRRLEHETAVENADAMRQILESLGFTLSLVYEKRRRTFRVETAEIVVDELPFGFYVEIEGDEAAILDAEKRLGMEDLPVEPRSYPTLTAELSRKTAMLAEARFDEKNS